MKPTEFYRWWIISETTGKRHLSKWHMSRETASSYKGAEPLLSSLEMRNLPEGPHEFEYNSAWQNQRP